jgi:hypothetical protein
MLITATDLQDFSGANSRTITALTGFTSANTWDGYYPIHKGIEIRVSHPDTTAIVIRPFYITVRLVGDQYNASSTISNSYEFGDTPGQAIKNYLELLIEELSWLEKHKAELSPSISEDFYLLQTYVQIV